MPDSTNDELREILKRAYYLGKDNKGYSDFELDADVSLIHQHTEQAIREAYKNAFMIVTDADLTDIQATDILAKKAGYGGIQLSDAQLTTNPKGE